MKKRIFLFQIIVVLLNSVYAQENKVIELTNIYKNADYDCYTDLIQKDIDDFTTWLEDSLIPKEWNKMQKDISDWETMMGKRMKRKKYQRKKQEWIDSFMNFIRPQPKHVDLRAEKKVFFLSISLRDMDSYQPGENIYDYIIVDSTRTFIVACLDDSLNIKGISDLDDKGSFETVREWVCYHHAGGSRRFDFMNKCPSEDLFFDDYFKRLLSMDYDVLLYWNQNLHLQYLYIKNGKIYLYRNDFEDIEFQEYINSRFVNKDDYFTNVWRRTYGIIYPTQRQREHGDFHYTRKTGHTPDSELRICR